MKIKGCCLQFMFMVGFAMASGYHYGLCMIMREYSPGLITATLVNVPYMIYLAFTMIFEYKIRVWVLYLVFVAGAVAHYVIVNEGLKVSSNAYNYLLAGDREQQNPEWYMEEMQAMRKNMVVSMTHMTSSNDNENSSYHGNGGNQPSYYETYDGSKSSS